MNIISFDIEEWYIEKAFYGARTQMYDEYDRYLSNILDMLDKNDTKGTFFCVGKLAVDFPDVVKKIARRGHEIGCHSNEHLWLTKMDYKRLAYDTHEAIAALEDVSGRKVKSYRAPAFSIGNDNKWALEVLVNNGIERDASIFPAERDFGGFAAFPTDKPSLVSYNGVSIKEFPICTTNLFGKILAYSGGGYFRFFPYNFIKNEMRKSEYAISYFHIADLLRNTTGIMTREEYETYFKEKGTFRNRIMRYIKASLGTKGAFDKMQKLIEQMDYINLEQADNQIDWGKISKVEI